MQLSARPDYGRWVKCVAVDKADNWMVSSIPILPHEFCICVTCRFAASFVQVCGGGPRLCLWHLRSLGATADFDTPQATPNTVMFHEDTVSLQNIK